MGFWVKSELGDGALPIAGVLSLAAVGRLVASLKSARGRNRRFVPGLRMKFRWWLRHKGVRPLTRAVSAQPRREVLRHGCQGRVSHLGGMVNTSIEQDRGSAHRGTPVEWTVSDRMDLAIPEVIAQMIPRWFGCL
jgi:hypothetical protein